MELKKLSKATKILSEIEALDKEIISLEKVASIMIGEEKESGITISFEKPKEVQANIDTEGYDSITHSLKAYASMFNYTMGISTTQAKVQYDFKFTNNDVLKILGACILIKHEKRNKLISELENIGFKI